MIMAEKKKSQLTVIYYALGIVISCAALTGIFWKIYASPKVKEESKAQVVEWYALTGSYQIKEKVDTCIEHKLKPVKETINLIFEMNLERLPEDKKYEYKVKKRMIDSR